MNERGALFLRREAGGFGFALNLRFVCVAKYATPLTKSRRIFGSARLFGMFQVHLAGKFDQSIQSVHVLIIEHLFYLIKRYFDASMAFGVGRSASPTYFWRSITDSGRKRLVEAGQGPAGSEAVESAL